MRRVRIVRLTCLCLLLLTDAAVAGEGWNRFRGPNGSGVSESSVPVSWGQRDFAWRTELPGAGHSSPVIYSDRLFVTSAEEDPGKRHLICLDRRSGKILWTRSHGFEPHRKHRNNSYATSTPAVDGSAVYVLWQSQAASSLAALTHEGEPIWRVDLGSYHGGHGTGVSPIVAGEAVIVACDQDRGSFLLAVDRASGKTLWRVDRDCQRATYSTPCIYRPDGRRPEVIFTEMHHGVTGVDLATGRVNWEMSVFGTFKQRAIGSPVVAGPLVLGTSGFTTAEKNVVAIQPPGAEEDGSPKEVYRLSKTVPHVPTPLVYGDLLLLWTDRGIVTCAEAATGELIWQQRVGGNFSSSPICAGGRIYCPDDRGTMIVLRAGRQFQVLARNPLGEGTRATPAVAGGTLYVHTFSHLVAIGK